MSEDRLSRVEDPVLRQAAFSVEQMSPGGIERPGAGCLRAGDLDAANTRLEGLLARTSEQDAPKRRGLETLLERIERLGSMLIEEQTIGIVYLGRREYALAPRLRSAAIEIDFCFGDKDGVVGLADIQEARRRYGLVRGPVGWNRLLLTDEIERKLFPERTLKSTDGLRLLPEDWLVEGVDPLLRLKNVCMHLDNDALARTYADIAARLATVARRDPTSQLSSVFEGALLYLGNLIRERNGVRPTITDIARIGCEDPEVKQLLRTPIEMSRKLIPSTLIDRYLMN